MAVADWEEWLKAAARTFSKNEDDDTLNELRMAGYGFGHWQRELAKAQKREERS